MEVGFVGWVLSELESRNALHRFGIRVRQAAERSRMLEPWRCGGFGTLIYRSGLKR